MQPPGKMVLEFKIQEQDFLDFQLFNASKSDRINKKKRNGTLLLTIGSLLVAIYFYFKQYLAMAIFFGVMAIIYALFYPTYFRWRYKNHYKAHIKEHYSKRFGQLEKIEIKEESIFATDKTGESSIRIKEIEKVDETSHHFFIKISTGLSLIIPKRELENCDELRSKFQSLGLAIHDERNWNWK